MVTWTTIYAVGVTWTTSFAQSVIQVTLVLTELWLRTGTFIVTLFQLDVTFVLTAFHFFGEYVVAWSISTPTRTWTAAWTMFITWTVGFAFFFLFLASSNTVSITGLTALRALIRSF